MSERVERLREKLFERDAQVVRIKMLAEDALLCDGGHHKQWYLERILAETGANVDAFAAAYDSTRGIAP